MREVWAAYSVVDHLAKRAFVADVMLYDRLVIPIPAADDRSRWQEKQWDEARQARLLSLLGDRAVPVVWDAELRAKWKSRWEAAKALGQQTDTAAMRMTPTVLMEKVPRSATGVVAVAAFDSPDALRTAVQMKENPAPMHAAAQAAPAGVLAAVIGREFLVPNNPKRNDEELLSERRIVAIKRLEVPAQARRLLALAAGVPARRHGSRPGGDRRCSRGDEGPHRG